MGHVHHEEKRLAPTQAVIGFVVTALIAGLIGFLAGSPPKTEIAEQRQKQVAMTAKIERATQANLLPVYDSPALGRADAPVTVVLFSNLMCRECNDLFAVMTDVAGDPDVRVVFKHVIDAQSPNAELQKQATLTATAVARAGSYVDFHGAVVGALSSPTPNNKVSPQQHILKATKRASITAEVLEQQLEDKDTAALLQADLNLAAKWRITQAPALIVNGRRVSVPRGGNVRGPVLNSLRRIVGEEKQKYQLLKDLVSDRPEAYYTLITALNYAPHGVKRAGVFTAMRETVHDTVDVTYQAPTL